MPQTVSCGSSASRLEPTRFVRKCRGRHRDGAPLESRRRIDQGWSTLDVIKRALEAAGVEFIEENGGGPGVRLRKPLKGKIT